MEKKEEPKVTQLPARAAHGVRAPMVSRPGPSLVEIVASPRSSGPGGRPWDAAGSIDVERLVVWSFRDQRADRFANRGLNAIEASAAGLEPRGRSSDGCAVIADIHHMGCRVDARATVVKDHIHPAAELVAVLLSGMAGGDMVRHYARLGGRPEGWEVPKRWFRPVVWAKPGEEGQWEWENEGRGPRGARYTRIIPTVTRDELARRRQAYGVWWEALDHLAWRLAARALGFAVTGPTAPREPWVEVGGGQGR